MNPIDFGGQRSKVKVTIEMHGNKLVNTVETKPLCASSSNLADMLTMVRGWSLLILEVTGQRWRPRWASFTNGGCAGMLRFALLYFHLRAQFCNTSTIFRLSWLIRWQCRSAAVKTRTWSPPLGKAGVMLAPHEFYCHGTDSRDTHGCTHIRPNGRPCCHAKSQ